MSDQKNPKTILLSDYCAPAYQIEQTKLTFEIFSDNTKVTATLKLLKLSDLDLTLDGQDLQTLSVQINGNELTSSDYCIANEQLIFSHRTLPKQFELTTVVIIAPKQNHALEGLYYSNGTYCTQCEAEGFRRITWYLDRPDVMSVFTTIIEADKTAYPVLLSNGNPGQIEALENNRQRIRWHDPHKKPCYLFALVAGQLAALEDRFVTLSKRQVTLRIYTRENNLDRCHFAMQAIKQSMRWDEVVYQREYDLDLFMVVAIDDFNMGAMENKGLNIFNSSCVLVKPDTGTDANYASVLGIIAHEYFHNWTGNRITCRDWFQLSLKEGLTVYRDQAFYADKTSRVVKRINDVKLLRAHQFPEDAGPLAHPVRPESYIEINNFYTVTVYEKGAEVIRMYHTILGKEGFHKGIQHYFQKHDGQAVTTDDFLTCMQAENEIDLEQFKLWYSQAGTPLVTCDWDYNEMAKTLTLHFTQSLADTPGQTQKQAMHIPIKIALLDAEGNEMKCLLEADAEGEDTDYLFHFRAQQQALTFHSVETRPVPSLFRGFSAPVKIKTAHTPSELAFLGRCDSDLFNRWDSLSQIITTQIKQLIALRLTQQNMVMETEVFTLVSQLLTDKSLDKQFVTEVLSLPTERVLAEDYEVIPVEAIHDALQFIRFQLATRLEGLMLRCYHENTNDAEYAFTSSQVGQRSLKNLMLSYLMCLKKASIDKWALQQFASAQNMTDIFAALGCFVLYDSVHRDAVLEQFYETWKNDALVINKWFAIQAASPLASTLSQLQRLMDLKAFSFKNPNNVRSLIGVFGQANPLCFHEPSGLGYQFVIQQVLRLDALNPIIASRMLKGCFSQWQRYDENRKSLQKACLQQVMSRQSISKDTYEVASKALA